MYYIKPVVSTNIVDGLTIKIEMAVEANDAKRYLEIEEIKYFNFFYC